MANLRYGKSDYPARLDSYNKPLANTVKTDHRPAAGAIAGAVNVQTILGTDVAQSQIDLATYIAAQHNASGTHVGDVYLTALTFEVQNIPASSAGTDCEIADFVMTSILMPFAGEINRMSVDLSEARTTGSVTFKPTINGTAVPTFNVKIDGVVTQHNYGANLPTPDTFDAGDYLGVEYGCSGWAPITADAIITLFITVNQ